MCTASISTGRRGMTGLQLCGSAWVEYSKSGMVVSAVLQASDRFDKYVDYLMSIQISKSKDRSGLSNHRVVQDSDFQAPA